MYRWLCFCMCFYYKIIHIILQELLDNKNRHFDHFSKQNACLIFFYAPNMESNAFING